MQADSFLSFRDVCIDYGRKPTVFNFTLSIPKGITFGLIGLNGAGKTTLIKALLSLRDMRQGDIFLNGQAPAQPENRKTLAYLPERFDPPWFLKGEEFIEFSMNLYGRTYDRAAALALAERVKLDPKVLRNKMNTYSKGMRQKVGLMATVLTGCDLMVLDEPMSGLDPAARAAVKDVLKQMKREGRTVFFSSHILSDMDEICDQVAVLHQGRLVFDGNVQGLKDKGGAENLERAFLSVIGADSLPGEAA